MRRTNASQKKVNFAKRNDVRETIDEEEHVAEEEDAPRMEDDGPGDREAALRAMKTAQTLIEVNGVDAYMAASEGRRAAAVAAAKEARQIAMREYSKEKADKVREKMDATSMLDPADALPFGFVIKLRDGHAGGVNCCTWADDGRHLASCAQDGSLVVWDMQTCAVKRSYVGHSGPVLQVRLKKECFRVCVCVKG
jgi:hypothetical protein